jgi:hypothetical protein
MADVKDAITSAISCNLSVCPPADLIVESQVKKNTLLRYHQKISRRQGA